MERNEKIKLPVPSPSPPAIIVVIIIVIINHKIHKIKSSQIEGGPDRTDDSSMANKTNNVEGRKLFHDTVVSPSLSLFLSLSLSSSRTVKAIEKDERQNDTMTDLILYSIFNSVRNLPIE